MSQIKVGDICRVIDPDHMHLPEHALVRIKRDVDDVTDMFHCELLMGTPKKPFTNLLVFAYRLEKLEKQP